VEVGKERKVSFCCVLSEVLSQVIVMISTSTNIWSLLSRGQTLVTLNTLHDKHIKPPSSD